MRLTKVSMPGSMGDAGAVSQARTSGDPSLYTPRLGSSVATTTERDAVNVKEKVLLALETDRENEDKEMRRWADAVHRYDTDLLFQQEQGFEPNALTVESRAAAKTAYERAKEAKHLYTVAVNAVRDA